jgi:hypothetical protein
LLYFIPLFDFVLNFTFHVTGFHALTRRGKDNRSRIKERSRIENSDETERSCAAEAGEVPTGDDRRMKKRQQQQQQQQSLVL